MTTFLLNDIPIESLGLVLTEGGPSLSGFNVRRNRLPWGGRAGVLLTPFGEVEARIIRLVFIGAVSTRSEAATVVDALSDVLTGPIEVRESGFTERVMRGLCRVYEAGVQLSPKFLNVEPQITVEIECDIAAKWDAEPGVLVVGTVPMPVPVGTVVQGGYITVTGPATTPFTIVYRGVSGIPLGSMTITPALLTGEHCIIELTSEEIVHVSATGAPTTVTDAYLTAGEFFGIAPRDAARDVDAFATLESSVPACYYYRLLWEN